MVLDYKSWMNGSNRHSCSEGHCGHIREADAQVNFGLSPTQALLDIFQHHGYQQLQPDNWTLGYQTKQWWWMETSPRDSSSFVRPYFPKYLPTLWKMDSYTKLLVPQTSEQFCVSNFALVQCLVTIRYYICLRHIVIPPRITSTQIDFMIFFRLLSKLLIETSKQNLDINLWNKKDARRYVYLVIQCIFFFFCCSFHEGSKPYVIQITGYV